MILESRVTVTCVHWQLPRSQDVQLLFYTPTHKCSKAMRAAKKALRRAIRVENAHQRKQIYINLMKTDTNKDAIFYQLVAKQRKTKREMSHALCVNGNIVSDNKGLLQAWASHFFKLGTQAPNANYDQHHLERITKNKKCISTYTNSFQPLKKAPATTIAEVKKSIKKLNNAKH